MSSQETAADRVVGSPGEQGHDGTLCSLRLSRRSTVPLAGGLVADAAELVGMPPADRARLQALTVEVTEAIVADGFGERDDIDVDVSVGRTPGGLMVGISDRGAPSDFANGAYPPRIAELVRMGFADGLQTHSEGRRGNRTEIVKELTYRSVGADPAFQAEVAAEIEAGSDPASVPDDAIEVRAMTPDDVLGVARLFYRCYGYSAYYLATIYEPEKLAEFVRAGRHMATIAVVPDGRVIGHVASEITSPDAVTGNIGEAVVDPDFRSRGLTMRIGALHLQRLLERGMVGQFTQAVTNHNRSQKAALAVGGHEVGVMLAGQRPSLQMAGFDETDQDLRRAVMLMFLGLPGLTQREVNVPPEYAEIVTRIYDAAGIDRTVHSQFRREIPDLPQRSRFRHELKPDSAVAYVTVVEFGQDFLMTLQEQLDQLRLNRYDLLLVHIPLSSPAAGSLASGLHDLGLSFCGVYPEFDDGDTLVLQSLNNQQIDPAAIVTASPLGAELRDFVVADYQRTVDRIDRRNRSRARLGRIYEALQ